jgi:PAS domain S-box-containing protein
MVLVNDISSQDLKEEERLQYLQMLDAGLYEIYLIDPATYRIHYVNRTVSVRTGYTMEEVLEMTLFDIDFDLFPEDLLPLNVTSSNPGSSGFSKESFHSRKDGSSYPVETFFQRVAYQSGFRILAVSLDITQRKEKEAQLKEAYEQQQVLLRETNHRIKNNLNLVSSLLSIQSDKLTNPQAKALFQDAINRMHALMLLHDQLFLPHHNNNQQVEMPDYVEQLVANLQKTFKVTDITFSLTVDPISLSAFEAMHCGLMINELVTNAIKHAYPKSFEAREKIVAITLKNMSDNELCLTVSDNGIGFTKDLEKPAENALGLRLLQSLAKQLSGKIVVENNGGTSFCVLFKHGTTTDL